MLTNPTYNSKITTRSLGYRWRVECLVAKIEKSMLGLFIKLSFFAVIHVFEMGSSKSLTAAPPMLHTLGIVKIALSQAMSPADRLLALVDKNQDLYLASNLTGTNRKFGKLGLSPCRYSFVTQ